MALTDLDNQTPADQRRTAKISRTIVATLPSGATDAIEVPMPDDKGVKSCQYYCADSVWVAATEAGLTATTISADPAISSYDAQIEFGSSRGGALEQETEFASVWIKPLAAPSADVLVYLVPGSGL